MHNTFLEFIEQTKKAEPKKNYDRTIFRVDEDGETRLRDTVLRNILAVIDKFDELVPIEGAYIGGKICTKNYEENTPVEVFVLIDQNDINQVIHDRLLSVSEDTNRGLVADTMHPLKVNIVMVDGDKGAKRWVFKQECCFNIEKDKWEKEQLELTDNVRSIFLDIKRNEPNDLVFFNKETPFTSVSFETFSLDTIEKIKRGIKNRLFDLTREANGKASNATEKNLVKKMLSEADIDSETLEAKFVTNDISEDIALNLLRQKYYYRILDAISSAKSNKSLEDDFTNELNGSLEIMAQNESVKKHMTFCEFVLTEDKKHIRALKKLKAAMKPGKAGKSQKANKAAAHENDARKMRRDNRKLSRMIAAYRELTSTPQAQLSDEFSCKNLIQRAKDQPKGFWPINVMQVQWVCNVYHCDMPTNKDRIKRLSNMPIALFKPRRGGYFLVKDERLSGFS